MENATIVEYSEVESFRRGNRVLTRIYGAREVTRTFTETGETVAHLSGNDQV